MIQNLDDEQLDLLEAIMGKDIDEVSEFDMILAELVEMGMDESEVHDLKQLAALMYEFLVQVPEIATKLNLEKDYDLLDNIQLYLLGLPRHRPLIMRRNLLPRFEERGPLWIRFLIDLDAIRMITSHVKFKRRKWNHIMRKLFTTSIDILARHEYGHFQKSLFQNVISVLSVINN